MNSLRREFISLVREASTAIFIAPCQQGTNGILTKPEDHEYFHNLDVPDTIKKWQGEIQKEDPWFKDMLPNVRFLLLTPPYLKTENQSIFSRTSLQLDSPTSLQLTNSYIPVPPLNRPLPPQPRARPSLHKRLHQRTTLPIMATIAMPVRRRRIQARRNSTHY